MNTDLKQAAQAMNDGELARTVVQKTEALLTGGLNSTVRRILMVQVRVFGAEMLRRARKR